MAGKKRKDDIMSWLTKSDIAYLERAVKEMDEGKGERHELIPEDEFRSLTDKIIDENFGLSEQLAK